MEALIAITTPRIPLLLSALRRCVYADVTRLLGAQPDPVSHEEFRRRQTNFCESLANGSVAIITNNPTAIRSRDTHYPYRFNSYLHYLTNWDEEQGVAVFYQLGCDWICRLYVKPRDITKEIWSGRVLGPEGALAEWPVTETESRLNLGTTLPKLLDLADEVYHITGLDEEVDNIVENYSGNISDPRIHLDDMRVIKSNSEIALMTYSGDLAALTHVEAMRRCKPGMGEWQLQAIIEGCFLYHESQWAYSSIVGCGDNATILHYTDNKSIMEDGELVLIDAGCEISGYASDITRTFPVNGRFTEPQRAIYELVLKAQLAGIEACQSGTPWSNMHHATSRVLAQGLLDLGILTGTLDDALGDDWNGPYRQFFMHGTGHFLGLDVHDVGGGRQGDGVPERILKPGMVVTIEPGLYFGAWREDIDIDSKWNGIGVRIEDDILITESGPVVLTEKCPKSIREIEALVGTL